VEAQPVIWFIGISGAGKSTLGTALRDQFAASGKKVSLLDGDQARDFFDHDLGYSREDRVANIKRIIFGAHLLSSHGTTVIVCNISPFENLRQFARKKIPGYHEIYLRKNLEISLQQDVRDVYRNHLGKSDLVGIDIQFEPPTNSDLIVDTDGHSEQESLRAILDYLHPKFPGAFL
jgi:adenylyl-sulfate kinase